ncbi:MAG: response regulator [Lachnospira sp.]|nr:response regulator [Lachnospira sp.]
MRDTILIVDDAIVNRAMLKHIFNEQYNILEAGDGEEAIPMIEENKDRIAVIFLDLLMPKKNGLDVLEYMDKKGLTDELPVIMITGESTAESDEKVYDYGAMDIIYKPFAPRVVMRRTMNIIDLYETRRDIENKLKARTKELIESQDKLRKNNEFLIDALSSVVEFRSLESGEHIRRVKFFTRIMLRHLIECFPEYKYLEPEVDAIVNASALHDIGKIAIPDKILLKPGKLDAEEFEEMKKHTTYGCDLLENFKQEDNQFYRYCYDIVRYHHERWDGEGYPDKLAGNDIPIWAQVVSIVDVYDALVSKRVYKEAYAVPEAVRMIMDGECGTFSPTILECFQLAKDDFFFATEVLGEFTFVDNIVNREEVE